MVERASRGNLAIPDFFIVAAPKCGTSTLYDWLGMHPAIHAPHKEPCFFSQDIFPTDALPTHIPSLAAYAEIFRLPTPAQLVSGEATPKYLYSDQALAEIARLRPDARLIVCLRDPTDLVISFHNQKFHEGEEREPLFERAWRRSVASNGQASLVEPAVRGEINYPFWGAVGHRLKRLHEAFPRDQIKIVTLGELKDEPGRVYAEVLAFLGVENDGKIDFAASNEGYRIRSPRLHRRAMLTKRVLSPLLRPIQKVRSGRGLGFLRLVNRWNTEPGRYANDVSAELRTEVREVLAEDTRIAETFLNGRRLSRITSGQ